MFCKKCDHTGWICEQHPDKPFPHDDCAGPGDPCPYCNNADHPRVHIGSKLIWSADGRKDADYFCDN